MVEEEKGMRESKMGNPDERSEAPKEKIMAHVRRVAGERGVRSEARPEMAGGGPEATCDACGRVHTESDRCEMFEYSGQKFHICGECIPPVHENPADFLAGKKGTAPESEDFDICGPRK